MTSIFCSVNISSHGKVILNHNFTSTSIVVELKMDIPNGGKWVKLISPLVLSDNLWSAFNFFFVGTSGFYRRLVGYLSHLSHGFVSSAKCGLVGFEYFVEFAVSYEQA